MEGLSSPLNGISSTTSLGDASGDDVGMVIEGIIPAVVEELPKASYSVKARVKKRLNYSY